MNDLNTILSKANSIFFYWWLYVVGHVNKLFETLFWKFHLSFSSFSSQTVSNSTCSIFKTDFHEVQPFYHDFHVPVFEILLHLFLCLLHCQHLWHLGTFSPLWETWGFRPGPTTQVWCDLHGCLKQVNKHQLLIMLNMLNITYIYTYKFHYFGGLTVHLISGI